MINQIKVLLLFGGESSEHTISISSAKNVYDAINKEKYEVLLSYIDKSGKWWLVNSFSQIDNLQSAQQISPILGGSGFIAIPLGQQISVDVILPILHGENGEDGTVQGLASLMHIPIVGCGVSASSICIDKVLTKRLLEESGIKTVPYEVHNISDPMPDYNELSNKLGNILFIKPAGCGSSVGISKSTNSDDLEKAIINAHQYDNKVLIEKAVTARELEVGVLGNGKDAKISSIGEILPDSDFYSFDSKYSDDSKSRVVIPADIPVELSDKIRSVAKKAFNSIGCRGISRIDFFYTNDQILYLNEINTLPGFTNVSMYPKLWQHGGISYSDLIELLISNALEK